jgi:peptidoglycan lytic transglycosylase G
VTLSRRGSGILLALLLIVGGAAGVGAWAWRDYRAPGPLTAAKTVVLPRGESVLVVARRLARNDVVANPWSFVAGLYLSGEAHRLKAGEYHFAAQMSGAAVARLIASGKVVEHRLTIPEGLTSAAIVALVDAAPGLVGKIARMPPDGTLLPNTYFFVRGEQRDALIGRMRRAMTKLLNRVWAERAADLPLTTPRQAVTLASIIEKETARLDERAHIAGIYLKRLRIDMRLQADPTVLYALSDHGAKPVSRPLDHADLAIPSPYNTYLHRGLPPGPIDNPGRASLFAALHPETTDDLYFVSDGDGAHHFARTLQQQDRNIMVLRRIDASKSAAEAK